MTADVDENGFWTCSKCKGVVRRDPELERPEHGMCWPCASEVLDDHLRARHVEDPCLKCSGAGQRMYGNGATWRRGAGAACMMMDVCDACWGTGDRYRTGCDLRRLRDEEEKRVAERAVDLLVRSCGATFPTAYKSIITIIEAIQKLADKRTTDFWTRPLALGLANTLRRAIGAPEVKER